MALSVSRLVRVLVNLSPLAASTRTFGVMLCAGDSNVIDGVERIRFYDTYEGVSLDFGTNAPEAKAAALYFGQTPKPKQMAIGRWFRTASSGFNKGGILTSAEQAISNFTSITNGGMVIVVDGVTKTLTGLNFSAKTNLNGVCDAINASLTGAVASFNGSQFIITSSTTGVSSTVGYATTGTGTDISAQLKLTSALSSGLVSGYAAETPAACATALANKSSNWYGLIFNASTQPSDSESLAVSDVIEALTVSRLYGVTITGTSVLSSSVTNDLASLMKAAGYKRSFCQYSANVAAVASFFGRAFSVNFNANRSTITMMYKQEPSVTPETITETQASTLKTKRCNIFVTYDNDTSIIQYGVMSGSAYFDEMHGLDWLQNSVQTNVYNLLYTSKTKVPQTDAGVNQIVNAVNQSMDAAVNNGLVAPGTWTADGFGQLTTGDYLKTGYYVYATPLALQSSGNRAARLAPPIQVAAKLAGAIQEVDVIIDVNR